MSAELKDLRAKITAEADVALEAENRATGKDKSEIVREILHAWALDRIHVASVMHKLLRAEGLPGITGECQGVSGSVRESQGFSGTTKVR